MFRKLILIAVLISGCGGGGGGGGGAGSSLSPAPAGPVPYTKGVVFTLDSAESPYWVYVPNAYDDTHMTPIRLFVWLHGCGGKGEDDIYMVSPGGAQSYIAITVGGREGACWDPNVDTAKVLAAIADIKSHFNIHPKQVVVGGYSSGGDLSYRTAFYNALVFAGVIVQNSAPFMDTGSSQAASLAAAAWKFNVAHQAHTGDDVYPILTVQNEIAAVAGAGHPVTYSEMPGLHYDLNTEDELKNFLAENINKGWVAP